MTKGTTRRDMMKQSLALAGAGMLGAPGWTLPALAQDETPVPFTDVPENFGRPNPASSIRIYDVRDIDGPYTPSIARRSSRLSRVGRSTRPDTPRRNPAGSMTGLSKC